LTQTFLSRAQEWAKSVKRDVIALWLAARDARTPWYAKLAGFCIAAYALSPIDLISDFIPIIGYLDELVMLPVAILFAIKLVPPEVMAEHRAAAGSAKVAPRSAAAATVIILIWLTAITGAGWLAYRYFG
jgi:uncharacterized membrane protein YkvA (DUF1232 family)